MTIYLRSTIFLCLFISITVFSQKPKSDNIDVEYTQFPLHPLESNLKSYSFSLNNKSTLKINGNNDLSVQLSLEGYIYNSTESDFNIEIAIESYKTDSYATTYKGTGFTAGGAQKYVYVIEGEITVSKQIRTFSDDAVFYNTELKNIDDFKFKIESKQIYNTEDEAKSALVKEKEAGLKALSKQVTTAFFTFMQHFLNKEHGYAEVIKGLPIWSIKSKKQDYSALDLAKNNYITAIDLINKKGLKENIKEKLSESISIWEKEITEYDPDNKKARISKNNIGALYLNLTLAHIWIKNFDEAKHYFNLSEDAKGQVLWKPFISELLISQEKGYQQNLLLQNKSLNIEKITTDDPMKKRYSKEFEILNNPYSVTKSLEPHRNGYRLKTIYYYEKNGRDKSGEKKVITYNQNGIAISIVDEFFSTKSPELSRPVRELNYEYVNDSSKVLYYSSGLFNDGELKRKRFIKQGKILEEVIYNSDTDQERKLVMNYDGVKWTGYEKFFNNKKREEMLLTYDGDKVAEITMSSNDQFTLPNDIWSYCKYKYHYSNGRLSSVSIHKDEGENPSFKELENTVTYTYNDKDQIVKTKLNGPFFSEYEYDINGNLSKVAIHMDTQHIRYNFEWEEGNGNEPLIRLRVDKLSPWNHPFLYPIPNTNL